MNTVGIPDVHERKSRRTHKNSRDGCPNCKAKRIKCTEELPECSNCLKKNNRCGYLDFPKEKLDLIRIKNENRRKEEIFMRSNIVEDKSKVKKLSSEHDSSPFHASSSNMSRDSSSSGSLNTIVTKTSTPFQRAPSQNHHFEGIPNINRSHLSSNDALQDTNGQSTGVIPLNPRQSLNSSTSGGSLSGNVKGYSVSSMSSGPQEFMSYNSDVNRNFPTYNNKFEVPYQPVSNDYHIPYYGTSDHVGSQDSSLRNNQDFSNPLPRNSGLPAHAANESAGSNGSQSSVMKYHPSPIMTSSASQTPQQIELIQPPFFNNISKLTSDVTFTPNSNHDSTAENGNYATNNMAVGTPLQQQSSVAQSNFQQPHEIQLQTTMLPHNSYTSFEIPNHPVLDFFDFTADMNAFGGSQFQQNYMLNDISGEPAPSVTDGVTEVPSSSSVEPPTEPVKEEFIKKEPETSSKRQISASEVPIKPKKSRTSLPNSIIKPTKFKRTRFVETRYLDTDLVYFFLPVWNNKLILRFWERTVYASFNNPVLFSFILDKTVGLLLTDVNIVLKSEYLKNFHNTYKPVTALEQPGHATNSLAPNTTEMFGRQPLMDEDFFFRKKILCRFIRLSVKYYSNLINNIKLHLNKYHFEETIRISVLSSYSSYFLLNSSIETSIKLNYGTSSLLQKFVNDCTDYSQLTPLTKYVLDMLHNHVNFCLVPDLKLDLVVKLAHQFKLFKNFLATGTSIYQALKKSSSIRDFFPKHDCIQLETFLNLLVDKLHPNIIKVNERYGGNLDEIRFVSVKDMFEIINQYFKMIPNITNVLGSRVFVFQRVFYLFFVALGKVLNHVLSPIRSLFNIDFTNVCLPSIEFNFQSFELNKERDGITDEQFEYLDKITKNLLRFISFLNYRTLLYGHYLSNSSVLCKPVVKLVNQKEGIIEILPSKLDFQEKHLEVSDDFDFNIELKNFPQFPEFKHYPRDCFTGDNSGNTGPDDFQKFNYNIGLLPSDFNPTTLINQFLENQKAKWEFNTIRLSELKTRSNRFNDIKAILNESINEKS